MVRCLWGATSNCTMTTSARDLFELAAAREHNGVLWTAAAVVPLIRRRPWQERKSSEVIFVIPRVAAASPSGRGFPRCLISHINHPIFMTITRAAVASVLRGSGAENSAAADWAEMLPALHPRTKCIVRDRSERGRLSISATQRDACP